MRVIPKVPTALVDVRVHRQAAPGAADVVLVAQPQAPASQPPTLGPGAGRLGVDEQRLAQYGMTGSAGSVQVVPLPNVQWNNVHGNSARASYGWLVGIGGGSAANWRAAGAALVRACAGRAEDDLPTQRNGDDIAARAMQVHLAPGTTTGQVAALALGCVVGSHRYRISRAEHPPRPSTVILITPPGQEPGALAEAVARAQVLGLATGLARDLVNTPSGAKDPTWLADTGARLAAGVPGLRATVRDDRWLTEYDFGGVLAVGGGSARPPRLLELTWHPPGSSAESHLVLVGKGITFDTGGISIKPADGMHLMRTDMSGGAAVIAALLALGQLQVPLRVTGLVPCAENHVSGSAYRPGDVVRQVGGATTEVTNTDAEGRLVLADALAYAVQTLAPTTVVDVATLTGAMKVSLGLRTGGLFASEPALAERIQAAGEAAGEAWWPMPLIDDHAAGVRSEIADLRQCPPGPSGITAALFLREFTAGLPWAHLDIAGPARAESSYDEVNPGGTGFATRTLIELACSFAG